MRTIQWAAFFAMGSVILNACSISEQSKAKELDQYLSSLIDQKQAVGIAVAVNQDGNWVWSNTYGFAELENNQHVTDSTRFHIMSITKQFVAVAVMQLVEKGLVNTPSPISTYIENLPKKYDSVYVYQLLNHSSGIPDYVEDPGFLKKSKLQKNPEEVIASMLTKPFLFRPGEKNEYSNTNYYLLGMLIERVAKIKLEDYLMKDIFIPADMRNTYLEGASKTNRSIAIGYTSSGTKWNEKSDVDPTQYWAAGGVVTTLRDMMKWNDALMSEKLVSASSLKQMITPVNLTNGIPAEYGFGFELMTLPHTKIAGHNGAGLGFNCSYMNFLDDKISVIVLTNSSNSNSTLIAKNIDDRLNNRKNSNEAVQSAKPLDKLDSLATQLMRAVSDKSTVDANHFLNEDVKEEFEEAVLDMIDDHGSFVSLTKQAEKINPETFVRRYTLKFKNSETGCIVIFSKEGKVAVINRK